jgi:hypothetical protein
MAFDERSALTGSAQAVHSQADMNESKHPVDPDLARALWLTGSTLPSSGTRPKTSYRRATPRQPVELYPRGSGRPLIFMSYTVGDYVVPSDLPRQFVCRVTHAHGVGNTPLQVLELAPLEGPWPPETRLVRGGDSVRPATQMEVNAVRHARAVRAGHGLRPGRASRSARPRRRFEVSDAG